jgi:hypothetical protein
MKSLQPAWRCFLAWLTLRPWKRYVPTKHRPTFSGLRGVISQKMELFIITVVRTLTLHKKFEAFQSIKCFIMWCRDLEILLRRLHIIPKVLFPLYYMSVAARGSVVGWGTMLLDGRSRARFPMMSLDFPINLILPAALWPWDRLSL